MHLNVFPNSCPVCKFVGLSVSAQNYLIQTVTEFLSMSECPDTPPKKKAKIRLFSTSWLKIPEFKEWLRPVNDDPSAAYCAYCKQTLKDTDRQKLERHRNAAKHKAAQSAIQSSPSMSSFMKPKNEAMDHKVAKAELNIAA